MSYVLGVSGFKLWFKPASSRDTYMRGRLELYETQMRKYKDSAASEEATYSHIVSRPGGLVIVRGCFEPMQLAVTHS